MESDMVGEEEDMVSESGGLFCSDTTSQNEL